jgi:hypothetical protein
VFVAIANQHIHNEAKHVCFLKTVNGEEVASDAFSNGVKVMFDVGYNDGTVTLWKQDAL